MEQGYEQNGRVEEHEGSAATNPLCLQTPSTVKDQAMGPWTSECTGGK